MSYGTTMEANSTAARRQTTSRANPALRSRASQTSSGSYRIRPEFSRSSSSNRRVWLSGGGTNPVENSRVGRSGTARARMAREKNLSTTTRRPTDGAGALLSRDPKCILYFHEQNVVAKRISCLGFGRRVSRGSWRRKRDGRDRSRRLSRHSLSIEVTRVRLQSAFPTSNEVSAVCAEDKTLRSLRRKIRPASRSYRNNYGRRYLE